MTVPYSVGLPFLINAVFDKYSDTAFFSHYFSDPASSDPVFGALVGPSLFSKDVLHVVGGYLPFN
jgi:hypothetical protein